MKELTKLEIDQVSGGLAAFDWGYLAGSLFMMAVRYQRAFNKTNTDSMLGAMQYGA